MNHTHLSIDCQKQDKNESILQISLISEAFELRYFYEHIYVNNDTNLWI